MTIETFEQKLFSCYTAHTNEKHNRDLFTIMTKFLNYSNGKQVTLHYNITPDGFYKYFLTVKLEYPTGSKVVFDSCKVTTREVKYFHYGFHSFVEGIDYINQMIKCEFEVETMKHLLNLNKSL